MAHTINVLHVYKTSLPKSKGGVEIFIDTLCKSTEKLGIRNTVLSLSQQPSKGSVQMEGYRVYEAKQNFFIASTGFSLSAFWLFKRLVQSADIIHYHFPNPFADMLHFVCRVKKPSIVTYHSDVIRQKHLFHLYRPLQKCFLNSVNHIVATSPNYLESSKVLKKYTDKTSVVPIGVDFSSYPKASEKRLTHWRSKLPKTFFLFVGAMRYYKGLHIALNAVKGTDIQLVLVGNGIEQELLQHTKKRDIGNIHFLGFASDEDKVALLSLCYGFVFPSHLRSEAFGIALLEAASFSKPLISCEIGTGTSYVNIDKETGLVIAPSSTEELRNAMQHLIDNPEIAKKFGRNAKKRANDLFTADEQSKSYFQIYENLLNVSLSKE